MLIDLVNNLKHLEENQESILKNVKAKVSEMNPTVLKKLVQEFGTVGTKKKFAELLNE